MIKTFSIPILSAISRQMESSGMSDSFKVNLISGMVYLLDGDC